MQEPLLEHMDSRLLDVIIGLACFVIMLILFAILPMVMEAGYAYLTTILVFILSLSGAGYLVNKQIA